MDLTRDLAVLEEPLDAISEGILVLDTHGSVVWFNRRLAELFAFPPNGVHGATRDALIEGMAARMIDPVAYRARVREIIANEEPFARDVLDLKSGRHIERTSRLRIVDGVGAGRVIVYRDVTREKHVTAALVDSEARFRAVIDAAPDGIILSQKWRITYANAAVMNALGRTMEELIDANVLDLIAPEARGDVHATATRIVEREQPGSLRERVFLRSDGTHVHFEVAALRIVLSGEPTVVLFMRDISERRRMQAQLAVSDRMASIGAMAAGVAHEINNPLAYVLANLELMRAQIAEVERDPTRERIETLRGMQAIAAEGCMRIKAVVGELATLSRTGANEETERLLDVRWTLDSSLKLARALVSTRARIVTEYAEAPLVRANDARLSQVFLNLLLNAAQAIEPGRPDENEVRVRCGKSEEGGVFVSISDTGRGIAPEDLPRIFDPFFTTKAPHEGTGLGLSICQSIVWGLGGSIRVEPGGARGTTFRVDLPSLAVA
jgi:two-component system, NtrC family, sensor kinase